MDKFNAIEGPGPHPQRHLSAIRRACGMDIWADSSFGTRIQWKAEIAEPITPDIFFQLTSPSFVASHP